MGRRSDYLNKEKLAALQRDIGEVAGMLKVLIKIIRKQTLEPLNPGPLSSK
jgi:hypothetical protein